MLPIVDEENFDEVTYQGKVIKVTDTVIVPQAGEKRKVMVSSISKKAGHYWVGYDDNTRACPWPLVQTMNND